MMHMEVQWRVDPVLQRAGWGPINAITSQVSAMVDSASVIVDLGGGAGWFGLHLASGHPGARVISVDITPRPGKPEVEHVRGSVLDLPLRDNVADMVGANAILHHVPEHLDKCIEEAVRVLRPGGIILVQEPLAGNPPARWTRGMVRTTAHEEGERPLRYEVMADIMREQGLEILDSRFFFLTGYLLPHIVPLLPPALRGPARRLGLMLTALDREMLDKMPRTRRYAAYACIIARKY